ncbi:MAG: FAD-binding oxidoreductase [Candidatus Acidiferrum sp.]
MPILSNSKNWGTPPWTIDFNPVVRAIPEEVDFAILGGGFTGLSAAAWLARLAPKKTIAVFEAETIGAGASGRTGGMALAESAGGDLPHLGDVLGGYQEILRELNISCELALPGVWELARRNPLARSPISWQDGGDLRAAKEVPGGTVDPGKVVSGLAAAAETSGVLLFENMRVDEVVFGAPLRLEIGGKTLRAHQVLFATNAQSLELAALAESTGAKLTLAVATEPLSLGQLEILGFASRKSFYTVDMPYLWGRLLPNNGIIFGSGLVHTKEWRELATLDISSGEAGGRMTSLEQRVRGLHPLLKNIEFTHRWGGPILIAEQMRPVFAWHPRSSSALVLGAYSGHGVALSVYLGRWAAQVFLSQRELPDWRGGSL